eukprot:TRINITY_DN5342_c0_g1_i1.p1 TRINITY_DN5342_c0_g1~~TRINITY_DN5342_c0_g1_i1.p1  ORF type:complete len:1701 (+),score=309.76 TRINITY_DN5342_c0_g1_i1:236-5338(+)
MFLVEHATEGYVACRVLRDRSPGGSNRRLIEGEVAGRLEQWWVSGTAGTALPMASRAGDCSGSNLASPDDLLDLADYSYASMLHALRLRHGRREPYTWIGPVLVSVNPCIELESFSACMIQRYLGHDRSTSPHPFAVVNRALEDSNCVAGGLAGLAAVVVTGESGAGKTEAVKAMLSFLVSRQGASCGRVCDVLIGSTQALEAFGNARTLQNGNSSRFGRLTEVWLDAVTGKAEGASVVPYMLEACRVSHHAAGEHNFHIFYILEEALRAASATPRNEELEPGSPSSTAVPLADFEELEAGSPSSTSGPPNDFEFWGEPSLWAGWRGLADLAIASRFRSSPYLWPRSSQKNADPVKKRLSWFEMETALTSEADAIGVDVIGQEMPTGNHGRMEDVAISMRAAGLEDEQIFSVTQILVAVGLLGNVPVDMFTAEAAVVVGAPKAIADGAAALASVAGLLQVREAVLRDFFVTRTSDAPRLGDVLTRPRSAQEAVTLRDSAAREIYSALFSWLVQHVRQGVASAKAPSTPSLPPRPTDRRARRVFAVLDIYGFEVCETNGLEQLLINYCNERLQGVFNAQMFAAEARDYAAEGLRPELWAPFVKTRELPALALLEGDDAERSAPGLFAIVDDEARCRFNSGCEAALRSRMDGALRGRVGYKFGRTATSFAVAHFAGDVVYESRSFVQTNASAARHEILTFLVAATSSSFLSEVLETKLAGSEGFAKNHSQLLGASDGEADGSATSGAEGGPPSARARSRTSSDGGRRQQLFGRTVIQAFRSELDRLVNSLQMEGTRCHYVRCLKPNAMLEPQQFDGGSVLRQCRYSGLLETVQIRHNGFPYRSSFAAFVERYAAACWPEELAARWGLLLPAQLRLLPATDLFAWTRKIVSIVKGLPVKGAAISCTEADSSGNDATNGIDLFVGRTKVLMRPRCFAALEAVLAVRERVVIKLQAMIRCGLWRMKFLLMRWLVGRLQAAQRGRRARQVVNALQELRKLQVEAQAEADAIAAENALAAEAAKEEEAKGPILMVRPPLPNGSREGAISKDSKDPKKQAGTRAAVAAMMVVASKENLPHTTSPRVTPRSRNRSSNTPRMPASGANVAKVAKVNDSDEQEQRHQEGMDAVQAQLNALRSYRAKMLRELHGQSQQFSAEASVGSGRQMQMPWSPPLSPQIPRGVGSPRVVSGSPRSSLQLPRPTTARGRAAPATGCGFQCQSGGVIPSANAGITAAPAVGSAGLPLAATTGRGAAVPPTFVGGSTSGQETPGIPLSHRSRGDGVAASRSVSPPGGGGGASVGIDSVGRRATGYSSARASGCLASWRGGSCGCTHCSWSARQLQHAQTGPSTQQLAQSLPSRRSPSPHRVASESPRLKEAGEARHSGLVQELLSRCGNISEMQTKIAHNDIEGVAEAKNVPVPVPNAPTSNVTRLYSGPARSAGCKAPVPVSRNRASSADRCSSRNGGGSVGATASTAVPAARRRGGAATPVQSAVQGGRLTPGTPRPARAIPAAQTAVSAAAMETSVSSHTPSLARSALHSSAPAIPTSSPQSTSAYVAVTSGTPPPSEPPISSPVAAQVGTSNCGPGPLLPNKRGPSVQPLNARPMVPAAPAWAGSANFVPPTSSPKQVPRLPVANICGGHAATTSPSAASVPSAPVVGATFVPVTIAGGTIEAVSTGSCGRRQASPQRNCLSRLSQAEIQRLYDEGA